MMFETHCETCPTVWPLTPFWGTHAWPTLAKEYSGDDDTTHTHCDCSCSQFVSSSLSSMRKEHYRHTHVCRLRPNPPFGRVSHSSVCVSAMRLLLFSSTAEPLAANTKSNGLCRSRAHREHTHTHTFTQAFINITLGKSARFANYIRCACVCECVQVCVCIFSECANLSKASRMCVSYPSDKIHETRTS